MRKHKRATGFTLKEAGVRLKEFFTRERKIAFFSAMVIALVVNFSVIAFNVHNPDTLGAGAYHGFSRWEISLGRWMASMFSMVRGGVATPVVAVVLSVVFLGLTAIIAVDLFKIRKTRYIVLMAGVLAASPTVGTTMLYHFCADAYIGAQLFAFLAVYLVCNYKNKMALIGSAILVALTLGTYQAYIGVAAGLLLAVSCLKLMTGEDMKDALLGLLKGLIVTLIGAALYYVITQIFLAVLGLGVASYSGADQISVVGIITGLPETMPRAYGAFVEFFLGDGVIKNTYWHRKYLYIMMAVAFMGVLVAVIRQKKVRPKALVLALVMLMSLPLAVNAIIIIAPGRALNLLMCAGIYVPFMIFIKLIDELKVEILWQNLVDWVGTLSMVVLLATFALAIQCANVARVYAFNQAQATMIRVLERVEEMPNYTRESKVCVEGALSKNDYPKRSKIYQLAMGDTSDKTEFWESYSYSGKYVREFIYQYMGATYMNFCTEEDAKEIADMDEFKEMGIFPDHSAIKEINGVIVVKLSEPKGK